MTLASAWFTKTTSGTPRQTIAWADGHNDVFLRIRAHPNTSTVNWHQLTEFLALRSDVAEQHFGTNKRVVYAPHLPVNTYDLIDRSDCVVVYVSTAGVEPTAVGKRAVLADDQWYAQTRIVRPVSDAPEYPADIDAMIDDSTLDPVDTTRLDLRFIWDSILSRSTQTRLSFCRNPNSVILRWELRRANAPRTKDDAGMDFLSDVILGRQLLYAPREPSPTDNSARGRSAAAKLVREFAARR